MNTQQETAPRPVWEHLRGLWRPRAPRPAHYLTRWLFLRLIAVVYLVAFLSYWVQMEGLVGSDGILPAEGLAGLLEEHLGTARYWTAPSVFWIYPHDVTLHLLCGAGVALSLVLAAGFLQPVCLLLLWGSYLSLVTFSQDFLSFQWDSLLLEVGFLSVFFAPMQWLPRLSKQAPPSPVALWLLRWVLFRLMFGSGAVKLGDETWRSLSALAYHFETQPLPTPLAWYANQLPPWVLQFAAAGVLFVEIVVPFLIFAPRRLRMAAFFPIVGLQGLIMLTGNFAFFNWLSVALCVLLLDDDYLRRAMPGWLSRRARCPESSPAQRMYARVGAAALATLVVLFSLLQLARLLDRRIEAPGPLGPVARAFEPFRLVNPYGLFAVMTTVRPEIVIEGSRDGVEWRAYDFKWKPGDVREAPGFVAPHQPRLDWQLWFAALGPPSQAPWFANLMVRLLQGSPAVLDLFERNPFPDAPPRYVRATLYQYAFTRKQEGQTPEAWWVREEMAPYFPRTALR